MYVIIRLLLCCSHFNISAQRGIGRPLYPNHPVKLSDGDSGELLIGGMETFMGYAQNLDSIHHIRLTISRYLNDDVGGKAIVDKEGFLHTGDICHKTGEYIFFDGRVSADCECTRASLSQMCTDTEQFSRPPVVQSLSASWRRLSKSSNTLKRRTSSPWRIKCLAVGSELLPDLSPKQSILNACETT